MVSKKRKFSIRDELREIRDLIEIAQISMERAVDLSKETPWENEVEKAGDAMEELRSLVDNLQYEIGRW